MKGIVIFNKPKRMEITEIWDTYNYNHSIVSIVDSEKAIYDVYAISENLDYGPELYEYMKSLNNSNLKFMHALNEDPNRLPVV